MLAGGEQAHAAPPKIKFETCLELRSVKLARLLDGGFWTVLWFAALQPPEDERVYVALL